MKLRGLRFRKFPIFQSKSLGRYYFIQSFQYKNVNSMEELSMAQRMALERELEKNSLDTNFDGNVKVIGDDRIILPANDYMIPTEQCTEMIFAKYKEKTEAAKSFQDIYSVFTYSMILLIQQIEDCVLMQESRIAKKYLHRDYVTDEESDPEDLEIALEKINPETKLRKEIEKLKEVTIPGNVTPLMIHIVDELIPKLMEIFDNDEDKSPEQKKKYLALIRRAERNMLDLAHCTASADLEMWIQNDYKVEMNTSMYNYLLLAVVHVGDPETVVDMMDRMKELDIFADDKTFQILMTQSVKYCDVQYAKNLAAYMQHHKIQMNEETTRMYNTLMDLNIQSPNQHVYIPGEQEEEEFSHRSKNSLITSETYGHLDPSRPEKFDSNDEEVL